MKESVTRGTLLVLLLATATPVDGLGQGPVVMPRLTGPVVEPNRITLVANPERVCFDARVSPYLNFDLILRNRTEQPIQVSELRAFVLDPAGELLERRVVAQQTLALLGPNLTVPPAGEQLLFNPFAFHSVRPDSRIRYEVHLAGGVAPPVEVMVTPQPCVTRTRLILPLAGRIAIYSGHDLLAHHRRSGYLGAGARAAGMIDNFQRFGLDLVVVNAQGRAFRGDGARNEEWFGWGKPVRAAGAGTVAAVRDGQPDNTVIGSENLWTPRPLSEDEMMMSGNYVLIDHGDGEFSLTSHLKNGSVRVREGDRIRAGDTIGEVGNSGASLHPHVHYELRSGWGVRGVRGLPAYFHDLTVIGTGEGGDDRPVRVNTGDVLVAQ